MFCIFSILILKCHPFRDIWWLRPVFLGCKDLFWLFATIIVELHSLLHLSNKEVIFSHDFRAGTESNVSALKVNFGAMESRIFFAVRAREIAESVVSNRQYVISFISETWTWNQYLIFLQFFSKKVI